MESTTPEPASQVRTPRAIFRNDFFPTTSFCLGEGVCGQRRKTANIISQKMGTQIALRAKLTTNYTPRAWHARLEAKLHALARASIPERASRWKTQARDCETDTWPAWDATQETQLAANLHTPTLARPADKPFPRHAAGCDAHARRRRGVSPVGLPVSSAAQRNKLCSCAHKMKHGF